jgi:hypothetical protein
MLLPICPPRAGCKHDESGITCIWDELAPGKTKLVTITANATRSGLQPSVAAVTTSSIDTDPTNNKAAVEVSVLVSVMGPGTWVVIGGVDVSIGVGRKAGCSSHQQQHYLTDSEPTTTQQQ